MSTDIITAIKESFESWYNKNIAQDSPVTILINYSDTQKMSIKAYHTASIEMCALRITDNNPTMVTLLELHENYNHGVTTEDEAAFSIIKKFLMHLYSFR